MSEPAAFDPRLDTVEGRLASMERKKQIRAKLSEQARELRDKGNSIDAISQRMNFPPSTIRSLLS